MANGNFGGGDGSIFNPYIIEDMLDFVAASKDISGAEKFIIVNDIDASEYIKDNSFEIIDFYNSMRIIDGLGHSINFGGIELHKSVFLDAFDLENINLINIRQSEGSFINRYGKLKKCGIVIDTSEGIDSEGYTTFGSLSGGCDFENCVINLRCHGNKNNNFKIDEFNTLNVNLDFTGIIKSYLNLDINLDYTIYTTEEPVHNIIANINLQGDQYKTSGEVYIFFNQVYTLNIPLEDYEKDLRQLKVGIQSSGYCYSNISLFTGYLFDLNELGAHSDETSINVYNHWYYQFGSGYSRNSYNILIPEYFVHTGFYRYPDYTLSIGSNIGLPFYETDSFIECNRIDILDIKKRNGVVTDDMLKQKITFKGFDFDNIWSIDDNNGGYPYFKWETFQGETKASLFISTPKGILNIPFYDIENVSNGSLFFKSIDKIKVIKLVSPDSPDALPIRIMTPKGIMSFSK